MYSAHHLLWCKRETLVFCNYLLKHEVCAKCRALISSMMNIYDYYIINALDMNIITVNTVPKIWDIGT
jgi:hypothetical protein